MTAPTLRIRRATVDDLVTLRPVWVSMALPGADLEKRLTEFQVVETTEGKVIGGLGFQIGDRQARIHSEAYSDFSFADAARLLFWERIQTLAMNHGIFRLWTQEHSPFWSRNGFQKANDETLKKLPAVWMNDYPWLTLQLKDETAMVSIEKELALFMQEEKQRSARALQHAQTLKTIALFVAILLLLLVLGAAIFIIRKHPELLHPRG
jgi:N-acetylglutamate synthase-like GNAT family acetyltransferase